MYPKKRPAASFSTAASRIAIAATTLVMADASNAYAVTATSSAEPPISASESGAIGSATGARLRRLDRLKYGSAVAPTKVNSDLKVKSDLLYGGGPVVTRAQVVAVLWGSKVARPVAEGIDGFFQALIASNYMDCLGEYDTRGLNVPVTTNQRIFRGTSVKTVTIQPKAKGVITFAKIGAELEAGIAAGVLPKPAVDTEGGVDTIFVLAFPPGVSLDDGQSCDTWCAEHGTLTVAGVKNVPIDLLPDFSSGGCATGCGAPNSNPGTFDAFTFNAAHEFVETVTDPIDSPTAWSDAEGNESADKCDNVSTIGKIGAYQVETWWSNRLGKCISGDKTLTLCDGTKRPCRPCSAQDCTTRDQMCDTSETSETVGQCMAVMTDADAGNARDASDGGMVIGDASRGDASSSGGTMSEDASRGEGAGGGQDAGDAGGGDAGDVSAASEDASLGPPGQEDGGGGDDEGSDAASATIADSGLRWSGVEGGSPDADSDVASAIDGAGSGGTPPLERDAANDGIGESGVSPEVATPAVEGVGCSASVAQRRMPGLSDLAMWGIVLGIALSRRGKRRPFERRL